MKKITLISLFFLAFTMAAFAQFNGEADSTFADNGVLLYDHNGNGNNEFLWKMVAGPNGKLYAGGFIQGQNRDILLMRFNADGTPDASFGNNGAVQFDPSLGGNDELADLFVTSTGKIVIVGTTNAGNTDQIIARFNSDGTLDTSFKQTGYWITGVAGVDTWMTVWVDSSDRIVVAGSMSDGSGQNLAVGRLMPNGNLDPSFGFNGLNVFDYGSNERFLDIHWHDFSKRYYLLALIDGKYSVMALNEDGDTENSFDGDGRKSLDLYGSDTESFMQVTTGPNGDLFLVGSVASSGDASDVLIVKMYNTGDLYLPFANNGIYRANLGQSASEYATEVLFLEDGTLLVSGVTQNAGDQDLMTFMLASDGFFFSNYGQNGVMRYPVENNVDEAGGWLCVDSAGKVYIYGTSVQPGNDDMVIIKLKTDEVSTAVKDQVPALTDLSVYPNPARDQLSLSFELPKATSVQINLHALDGRAIAALSLGHLPAGPQTVDGAALLRYAGPGMYLLSIQTEGQVYTQKLMVR